MQFRVEELRHNVAVIHLKVSNILGECNTLYIQMYLKVRLVQKVQLMTCADHEIADDSMKLLSLPQ